MKNGKVAGKQDGMMVGDKVGKRSDSWSKGSDLTEGVSARESCSVKEMYSPDEDKNRMPKGHDRV